MSDGKSRDVAGTSDEQYDQAEGGAEPMPPPNAADFEKNAPLASSMFAGAVKLMLARARQQAKPVPMPWPEVERAMGGGLWPGLHVLTGTTGSGKTQFALQVAFKAARVGVPTLYIGLELGELDLTARLLALAEGESTGHTPPKWSDIYLGKINSGELERLGREHGPRITELPFHSEFGPPNGWGADKLHERVRGMREMYPETTPGDRPLLVVLDYLQAVGESAGRPLDLRERIGQAAYAGRTVARDHGAAVLMLSSVSRESAKRLRVGEADDATKPDETNPADLVGLGKESGEIEYAADTVLALVSGQYQEHKPTPMHLALAKMRAGRAAWCSLQFDGSTFTPGTPSYRSAETFTKNNPLGDD